MIARQHQESHRSHAPVLVSEGDHQPVVAKRIRRGRLARLGTVERNRDPVPLLQFSVDRPAGSGHVSYGQANEQRADAM